MNNNLGDILKQYQVLKEGHFLLTSGLHSRYYFEKFRILEHPALVTLFSQKIGEHFKDKKIDLVCGPTTGGVIIAFEVARQLGVLQQNASGSLRTASRRLPTARCVFAEKTGTGRVIGRGFEIKPDERILVVDDVLTTGGSIRDTLDAVKPFAGEIAGVAVFIDRSENLSWDIPFFSAYRHPVVNYQPDDCPLCKKNIPLDKPGGKKL